MKANYQKLSLDLNQDLFMDFWVRSDYFGFHWHYHPEMEICYVKKGYGQRIVGSSVERFAAGDLVLVGPNLPHSWISDNAFNESENQMEVFVIHLHTQKLQTILSLQEFTELDSFLKRSRSGIAFETALEPNLVKHLQDFEKKEGLAKALHVLVLLEQLFLSTSQRLLCPTSYIPETGKYVEERIQKVCKFIHANYRRRISLGELASIGHMNPTAFCRFFKKVLGKTPVMYINELRINSASHELVISSKAINQIAQDNGFQSLSQFNKLFKSYYQMTPSAYRKSLNKR